MNQLEAAEHVLFFEQIEHFHKLCGVQAKDTPVTAGIRPVSAGLGCQFDPDPQNRLCIQRFGPFNNQRNFTGHFHNQDTE